MRTRNTATFGSSVRDARVKAGLSLSHAADEAEMSKSLVYAWEQDHVTSPDLSKVMRLAAVLELDPLELILLLPQGSGFANALPGVTPYLRSKYPTLPKKAVAEIAAVVRKYGLDPNGTGPALGQDELPE